MCNFFKRILKTLICSAISFFIWFGLSKCFATTSEWDLSQEKQTYIEIANFYNSGYTTPFYSDVKSEYMQPAFIESFFSTVEQKLNDTTRLRENAPYCVIKFQSSNEIRLYFCSDIQISNNSLKFVTYNSFYLKYFYNNGLLTYDNLYSWSSGTTTFADLVNISGTNYGSIKGFLLSNFSGFQWNSSYGPYASKTMWAETYITENLMQFNPTLNYNNNLLLNIDVIKGDDVIYDYDFFYYDENENIISVKDKISYKSSSLWYGDLYGFYISNNAISQFLNNTDFYFTITYKPYNSTNYTISNNTMLAFKTSSSITNPDSGGDTGGGGGSEGGGDTGGTSVDLSNIENTLGEINTTIIEVGTETNQNLDEINQSIQDLNNNITTVPDLSQKEEITGNDIIENLGFEVTVNPYDNFWSTLVNQLQMVLTSNNNRTITLEFRGETYTISVDDFNFDKMPSILKNFLQLFSVSVLTYFLLCWVKKSVDLIASGDMSEVLQMNEEEGIVDLF